MTSVVGCLSDLQALWLHGWVQGSASASEADYGCAPFVTLSSRCRAIPPTRWTHGHPGPNVTWLWGWVLQLSPSDAQGSRLCLAYDRHLHSGMCSDGRREVLCSPYRRENLGASLAEQFIYSSSHSSSLRKVPLWRKWQDKSFGFHYSEQMCRL